MDIPAKCLLTADPSLLLARQERCTGKAYQHHLIAHDLTHRLVEDTPLGAVALIYKDI